MVISKTDLQNILIEILAYRETREGDHLGNAIRMLRQLISADETTADCAPGRLVYDLRMANARGVAPPPNWTDRAITAIESQQLEIKSLQSRVAVKCAQRLSNNGDGKHG